jgi:C4-dicarboxylate transporter DctQ subunit
MKNFWYIVDNIESCICRTLLAIFVCLLFMQIIVRTAFNFSFSWVEELSVYMFVWFVFFDASYAAKMGAHIRVTFQLKFLPASAIKYVEAIADLFWIFFNVYFVHLSLDFIFNRMNKFPSSQTLGY